MSRGIKILLPLAFLVAIVAVVFRLPRQEISQTLKTSQIAQLWRSGSADMTNEGDDLVVIGIDLGSLDCRVGITRGGKFEIIPDIQGQVKTPSYVHFTEHGYVVGEAAKALASHNPKATIHNIRNLVGRRSSDDAFRHAAKDAAIEVVDQDGIFAVQLQIDGKPKTFPAHEILAKLILKLKHDAELYLDQPVKHAVTTVPAHFDDLQRQLLKEAGLLAGLEFMRVVNEPTAAGIAYRIDSDLYAKEEGKVLSFDISEDTCHVTVTLIEEGIYEILSTHPLFRAGEENLTGRHIDSVLLDYVSAEYDRQNGKDVSSDLGAMGRLRHEIGDAENLLRSNSSASVAVQPRRHISNFSTDVSPETFNDLNKQLFLKTLPAINKALKDAQIQKSEVDTILVTGEPSRIWKIQPHLEEYFGRQAMTNNIPSNEAFVRGAARQGEILSQPQDGCFFWFEMNYLGLGIEIDGGIFQKLIHRNTIIPTRKTLNITTSRDNQSQITVNIFEGQRLMVRDNKLLGTIELDGLSLAPAGLPDIQIIFEFDLNRTLRVELSELGTTNKKVLVINQTTEYEDHDDLEKMLYEAEENIEADEAAVKRALEATELSGKSNFKVKTEMK